MVGSSNLSGHTMRWLLLLLALLLSCGSEPAIYTAQEPEDALYRVVGTNYEDTCDRVITKEEQVFWMTNQTDDLWSLYAARQTTDGFYVLGVSPDGWQYVGGRDQMYIGCHVTSTWWIDMTYTPDGIEGHITDMITFDCLSPAICLEKWYFTGEKIADFNN